MEKCDQDHEMERTAIHELEKWRASRYRKPLIVNGIRQVGKTWLLKEFGRRHYTNTAYFNFEEQPEFREFFATTKDPSRILQNLMMASGQTITPETTLIIFDEIQEAPDALTALKYFAEHAPEYHIACAGSLLGVALAKPSSFPVGKVDFLEMYPMSFSEFLLACGDENLATYLESLDAVEPLPDAFFNPLYEKLKMYFICGGLPEVVLAWAEDQNVDEVQKRLANIITAYERDFAKHMSPKDYPKATLIWNSVPSQLAKENKKFIYRVVKEGARAREYEDALQWLCDAKLLVKVYRNSTPRLPMAAYDDISAFKLYLADVGLLRRLAQLDPSVFRERNRLFAEFKGSLSENYVLQALTPQFDADLRYWAMDHPDYEVDFLLQRKNDVIPVEVKSEGNVEGRSLKKFKEKYGDEVKIRVRFSLANLKLDGDVLNIPLFLADSTDKLIGIALRELYGEEY
ncbi:MAG: ATP-binding protein [Methanocorpusculum sp.]|nr:ATP-binding protein [Methanocorpusculum sp.]